MDQPRYDIYFTGQLVEGTATDTAIANIATLFKSSPETMAPLFNGKAHPLKRGVDKAAALKYKAALHKAGLVVAFKAHQDGEPKATPSEAATSNSTAAPPPTAAPQQEEDWSIAPAGSDVLRDDEKQQTPERDIDTSNIKMVSAFMDLEPEPKNEPPPPNTSHLSLASAGEDLLEEKSPTLPPRPMDLDYITLAPAGAELEELQNELPPLDPDTSALSLAEAGTDLLEGQVKAPAPEAPSTDHLSVSND